MIAPSLLAADYGQLAAEVASIEQAGADMLHLDVMDGMFVPNISFGADVIAALRETTALPFDVHLMIVDPQRYVDRFVASGADIVTVHAEACVHLHRTIEEIHHAGVRAGVALNPATPLSAVTHVLDCLDLLLIMSVNPGFGGQSYLPLAACKLRQAMGLRSELGLDKLILEVDGGITAATAPDVIEAGADVLVAGTAVFKASDRKDAISRLRQAPG